MKQLHSGEAVKTNSILSPIFIVAGMAMMLALLYVATLEWLGQGYYAFANQVGPGVLIMTCFWAGFEIAKLNAIAMWSPLPWFIGISGIYFGFGPLAYYFATPESIAYMDSLYTVSERELLYTNLLNAAGIFVVCLSSGLAITLLPSRMKASGTYDHVLTKRLMWIFLAVGGTVKYCFTLPYNLGWFSWVLPGSVQHLASLISSAIILLIILIFNGDRKYQWLLYPLIVTEIMSGIFMLSKLEVILTVLAIVLALNFCRPNPKVLIGAAVGLVILYALVLSPFVTFARIYLGGNSAQETEDLQVAFSDYGHVDRNNLAFLNPEIQGWWTRLSYSNVQAFAMDAYDQRAPGRTFELLPYVFVPRLLFPEKLVMTSGADFTQALTGEESGSKTGLGVFGEAYWNGGWVMLVTGCLYVGILFALFCYLSMRLLMNQEYVYIPVIMIGVLIGLRPDDWFVPTFVGGIIEAICLFMILHVLHLCLRAISPVRLVR